MRRSVETACRHHVSVGAHPGYIDRDSFGRRALSLPLDTVRTIVADQIAALLDVAAAAQCPSSRQAHGALYNQAAIDSSLARRSRSGQRHLACPDARRACRIVVAPGRPYAGLQWLRKAFADRAYQADGSLCHARTLARCSTGLRRLRASRFRSPEIAPQSRSTVRASRSALTRCAFTAIPQARWRFCGLSAALSRTPHHDRRAERIAIAASPTVPPRQPPDEPSSPRRSAGCSTRWTCCSRSSSMRCDESSASTIG